MSSSPYPVLTHQTEKALIARILVGDHSAKRELVDASMDIAFKLGRSFSRRYRLHKEDEGFSLAWIAVNNAVNSLKHENLSFYFHCLYHARTVFAEFHHSQISVIKSPIRPYLKGNILSVEKRKLKAFRAQLTVPIHYEIDEFGIPSSLLVDKNSSDFVSFIADQDEIKSQMMIVEHAISCLNSQEKKVFLQVHGINGTPMKTMIEISVEMNRCPTRISQIHSSAMRKIKSYLKKNRI